MSKRKRKKSIEQSRTIVSFVLADGNVNAKFKDGTQHRVVAWALVRDKDEFGETQSIVGMVLVEGIAELDFVDSPTWSANDFEAYVE